MFQRVLVTGGAGFVGSAVCRKLVAETGAQVLNLDKLTYAGNLKSVAGLEQSGQYEFLHGDICDESLMSDIMRLFRPNLVLHLAAETHVDRSIEAPGEFIRTNVEGMRVLLEAGQARYDSLERDDKDRFRVVCVSTDEVFGALGPDDAPFDETTPYDPQSPYSASKAAGDHLARAWRNTYGLPVVITNCSNNYGPCQHSEKLIPRMIFAALSDQQLPVYGRGSNIRDWLHVADHASALMLTAERGVPGETYCIGGGAERRNIDVVRMICDALDKQSPRADGRSYHDQIAFVTDRKGHDFRYAVNDAKIRTEFGWTRQNTFETGLFETVAWYVANQGWNEPDRGESQVIQAPPRMMSRRA